jgi:hypothetical protein
MNFIKMLMMGVAITASLTGAQGLMAADEMPNGSINIAGHEDGAYKPCSVPLMRTYDYTFLTDIPCVNDRGNYFQVDNAPSATLITFYSDVNRSERRCHENSGTHFGWQYTLKTIKHPTTTKWIKIDDLHSRDVGEIVVPGIVLVAKLEVSGDRIDELSCVRVVRSALP